MSDWQKWSAAWPDWQDAGKRVAIRIGPVEIEGELTISDTFFDGEDEYPEFAVRTDDGVERAFASCNEWRFL